MLIRSIFPGVHSRDKLQCSYEIKLTDIENDSKQNIEFYKKYKE